MIVARAALGLLGRLVARRDSGNKDSEFGPFVLGSYCAAPVTWCELGFKNFELKRHLSFPLGFNFNSSHIYEGVFYKM